MFDLLSEDLTPYPTGHTEKLLEKLHVVTERREKPTAAPADEPLAPETIPVLLTSDTVACGIYRNLVEPTLRALGLSCTKAEVKNGMRDEDFGKTLAMLRLSGCGVWIYGGLSRSLDRLASEAVQAGVRAVVLAAYESAMGSRVRVLRSRLVSSESGQRTEDAQYLVQQAVFGKVHDRLARAEDSLWKGASHGAMALLGSVLEYVVGAVSTAAPGKVALGKSAGTMRRQVGAIYKLPQVRNSDVQWPPEDDVLDFWDLRNSVVHNGVEATEEQVRSALLLMNNLVFHLATLLGVVVFPSSMEPGQQSAGSSPLG